MADNRHNYMPSHYKWLRNEEKFETNKIKT